MISNLGRIGSAASHAHKTLGFICHLFLLVLNKTHGNNSGSFFVLWCGSTTKLLNLKICLKETPLLGETCIKTYKIDFCNKHLRNSNIVAWK